VEIFLLLSVLWRRKWSIVLSALAFLGTAGIGTYLMPTQYTTETHVMVDADESATSILNDLGLSEMAMSLTQSSDNLENKLYLATRAPVTAEVIWRMQLRKRTGELYLPEDVVEAGLLAPIVGIPSVSVDQTEGTDVLVIEATAHTREAAQLLADTVARTWIDSERRHGRQQYDQAAVFIQEQLARVRIELDDAFGKIATAQADNRLIDLEAEVKAAVNRLSDLYTDESSTVARLAETRARLSEARSFRSNEDVDGVAATTMGQNPVIAELRKTLTEVRSQRAQLLATGFTTKAPEVREADARIDAVRGELEKALDESRKLDPLAQSLAADLAGLEERAAATRADIETTQERWGRYPDQMRTFSELKLAAEAAEQVFRSLQSQQYEIGIAAAMSGSDLRITTPAAVPIDPASPKPVLNVLAALILGLGFGVATAMLLEYVDDTVRTGDDVKRAWQLPQLGLLPRFKATSRAFLADAAPTDPVAEAWRTLRNGLEFASLDQPLRWLLVTSCAPGEGKSTVAINLAITLAQQGKRVLVIDADLRIPTQHRQFPGVAAEPGLTELLTGACAEADALRALPVEGLTLLPSGAIPSNPGQIVESQRLADLVRQLATSFDVVITDTPPVLAVNDAVMLGNHADGVLLVVESNQTTRRMLADVKARLEGSKGKLLGFALNKVARGNNPYGAYTRAYQRKR
jgi:capsular exopolysaccharide synthesis family protein